MGTTITDFQPILSSAKQSNIITDFEPIDKNIVTDFQPVTKSEFASTSKILGETWWEGVKSYPELAKQTTAYKLYKEDKKEEYYKMPYGLFVETPFAVASGITSFIGSLIAGGGALAQQTKEKIFKGKDIDWTIVKGAMEDLYEISQNSKLLSLLQPQTETGKVATSLIFAPFEMYAHVVNALGQQHVDAVGATEEEAKQIMAKYQIVGDVLLAISPLAKDKVSKTNATKRLYNQLGKEKAQTLIEKGQEFYEKQLQKPTEKPEVAPPTKPEAPKPAEVSVEAPTEPAPSVPAVEIERGELGNRQWKVGKWTFNEIGKDKLTQENLNYHAQIALFVQKSIPEMNKDFWVNLGGKGGLASETGIKTSMFKDNIEAKDYMEISLLRESDKYILKSLSEIYGYKNVADAQQMLHEIGHTLKKGTESQIDKWSVQQTQKFLAEAQKLKAQPTPSVPEGEGAPSAEMPPPTKVVRIEEPNIPLGSVDKPHGLFTTPSGMKSPHEDLGGERFELAVNPDANILKIDATPENLLTPRGIYQSSANLVALRKFLSKDEVARLDSLGKTELITELKQKYPKIEWSKYYDKQEMFEGLGGLLARENGYDAIWGYDIKSPEYSEYVGLTNKAFLKGKTPTEGAPSKIEEGVTKTKLKKPAEIKGKSPLDIFKNEQGFIRLNRERKTPQERIAEQQLDAKIKDTRQKDINVLKEWISKPISTFKSETGKKLSFEGYKQTQLFRHKFSEVTNTFRQLEKGLLEEELKNVTRTLYRIEDGSLPMDAIKALPKKQADLAYALRAYFEDIKTRVITDKTKALKDRLTPEELSELEALKQGVSSEGISEKAKNAYEEYQEVQKWGLEDYITHIARGNIRILTNEGKLIDIGSTIAEAKEIARKYLRANPETKEIILTDSFQPTSEVPTLLSRGSYWKLSRDLMDLLGKDAEAIQKLLHEEFPTVVIKPTLKYAKPMQKRTGAFKGEENIMDVLYAYSYSMEKKLALDPVLRQAKKDLQKLSPNERTAMESYIADIKGRKTFADKMVDGLFEQLKIDSVKPFAYSRAISKLTGATTYLKLGYRPVASVVNLFSGQLHNWNKLGSRAYVETMKFLRTEEGRQLIKENEAYLSIESSIAESYGGKVKNILSPMGMFQMPEMPNRKIAFAGSYLMGRNKFKMSHPEAIDFATKSISFWQFTYDISSLPRIMRSPTGRLIGQFKPFLMQEFAFVKSLRGAEIPRYIAGFMAMGGPRAALIILKSLPVLGALGLLDDVEEYLMRKFPRASTGVGGLLKIDISPSVAYQFPERLEDWMGIVLSDMIKLAKPFYNTLKGTKVRTQKELTEWARRLSPAIYKWTQVIESELDEDGWIHNIRGEKTYKLEGWDWLRMLMGAKPLKQSQYEVETWYLRQKEDVRKKNAKQTIQEYWDARNSKDPERIKKAIIELRALRVKKESIKEAGKRIHKKPERRIIKQLPKASRREAIKKFREINE